MACTLEKVLGDARTLLERLKEHDTAAEGLIEQSGALSQRVQSMREVGNALPEKVRTSISTGYNLKTVTKKCHSSAALLNGIHTEVVRQDFVQLQLNVTHTFRTKVVK